MADRLIHRILNNNGDLISENSDTFLTYAKGIPQRINFCVFLREYNCIDKFLLNVIK